jgi:hypothetical protein
MGRRKTVTIRFPGSSGCIKEKRVVTFLFKKGDGLLMRPLFKKRRNLELAIEMIRVLIIDDAVGLQRIQGEIFNDCLKDISVNSVSA